MQRAILPLNLLFWYPSFSKSIKIFYPKYWRFDLSMTKCTRWHRCAMVLRNGASETRSNPGFRLLMFSGSGFWKIPKRHRKISPSNQNGKAGVDTLVRKRKSHVFIVPPKCWSHWRLNLHERIDSVVQRVASPCKIFTFAKTLLFCILMAPAIFFLASLLFKVWRCILQAPRFIFDRNHSCTKKPTCYGATTILKGILRRTPKTYHQQLPSAVTRKSFKFRWCCQTGKAVNDCPDW